MTISAILMGVFMTSLAVTVYYKEQFYNKHCLPLRLNATLPDHCLQNDNNMTNIVTEDSEDSESRAMLLTVFDVWPALSVILYILVFGAGVGTIPWLLLGELCPSKVKGVASGLTVAVAFICIFAVVKLFPFGLKYLTPSGTYAFFALVRLNPFRKLIYHNISIFSTSGEHSYGNIHCVFCSRDKREKFTRNPNYVW